MNTRPGPRSRPAEAAPGGALYEGVELAAEDLAETPPGPRLKHSLRQWCEPPCILPFLHFGDCWDGNP